MPTDDESHADADRITNQQECVSLESSKRLFRLLVFSHDGVLN
jgi:hypothetical protein